MRFPRVKNCSSKVIVSENLSSFFESIIIRNSYSFPLSIINPKAVLPYFMLPRDG